MNAYFWQYDVCVTFSCFLVTMVGYSGQPTHTWLCFISITLPDIIPKGIYVSVWNQTSNFSLTKQMWSCSMYKLEILTIFTIPPKNLYKIFTSPVVSGPCARILSFHQASEEYNLLVNDLSLSLCLPDGKLSRLNSLFANNTFNVIWKSKSCSNHKQALSL